ncbi:hypothetical protein HDV00_001771 [Rhizophlyctis rosea]|nr:hypothetical protein HDV00_001771 [Rhizophlyctis rosea]
MSERCSQSFTELPEGLKTLILSMVSLPKSQLVHVVASLQPWCYPKTDLFHWVGVLNYFDSILEELVKEYDLNRVQEREFSQEDKEAVMAILEFRTVLMENYLDVLNASLRLLFRSAQQMHNQRSLRTAFGTSQDRLITLAQHWGPKYFSVSFTQLAAGKVELSLEWPSVTYRFYRNTTKTTLHGLITINVNNVMESGKSSRDLYKELVEKHDVPDAHRFALYQRVRVAFGLADSQERKKLLLSRMNAIAVLAILVSEDIAQNKILLHEPDLVQKLADLCSAKEVGYDFRIAALHALDSISSHHTKLSEVLTPINASANHRILMYSLRNALTEMDKDVPAQYVDSLFGFISRLCATQTGGTMLVSAGLVPTLIHLLDNRRESQIKVITKTVAMMDNILFGCEEALVSCVHADGLRCVVRLIQDSVTEAYKRASEDGAGEERVIFFLEILTRIIINQNCPSLRRLILLYTPLPNCLLRILLQGAVAPSSRLFVSAVNLLIAFIQDDAPFIGRLCELGLPQTLLDILATINLSPSILSVLPNVLDTLCQSSIGVHLILPFMRIHNRRFKVLNSVNGDGTADDNPQLKGTRTEGVADAAEVTRAKTLDLLRRKIEKEKNIRDAVQRCPFLAGVDIHSDKGTVDHLTLELEAYYAYIKPTDGEHEKRGRVIAFYGRSLGPSVMVGAFGSYSNRLYLPTGDLDLVIRRDGGDDYGLDAYDVAHNGLASYSPAFKALARQGTFNPILKSYCPVLKLVDDHSGLHIDATFNNMSGIQGSEAVKKLLAEERQLAPIVMLIKLWLDISGLSGTGGITGFCSIILCAAYLRHSRETLQGQSLGSIVMGFFKFFGNSFDYATRAVQVRRPYIFDARSVHWERRPRLKNAGDVPLIVLDPKQYNNNVAAATTNAKQFQQACLEAHAAIEQAVADKKPFLLSSILHIPPEMLADRDRFLRVRL